MINKQQIVVLMLLLLVLLSGCGKMPTQNTNGSDQETTQPEAAISCQFIPKRVENPNGFPVLKWVCLVDDATLYTASTKAWTEEVGADINQALAERDLPFRLQIVLLTAKGYFYDWLAEYKERSAIPFLSVGYATNL